MKYAVWVPADQTITYLCPDGETETTVHSEAGLWDARTDAEAVAKRWNDAIPLTWTDDTGVVQVLTPELRARSEADVADVADPVEFCGRPDTW